MNAPQISSIRWKLGLLVAAHAAITSVCVGETDLFTVNENGGNGVDQTAPLICETAHGALLIYLDERTGKKTYRLQAIDAMGMPSGPSTSLDGQFENLALVNLITVAGSSQGDAVVAWTRSDTNDLRVLRIDAATASIIGEHSVLLTDEPALSPYMPINVHLSPQGNVVLVFENFSGSRRTRSYSPSHEPFGPSIEFEDDGDGNYVDAAFTANGSFSLAWKSRPSGQSGQSVWTQRFSPEALAMSLAYELGETNWDVDVIPIGSSADDGAVVAWPAEHNGEDVVWGQRLDENGSPIGTPQLLIEDASDRLQPGDIYERNNGGWCLVQDVANSAATVTVNQFDDGLLPSGDAIEIATESAPYSAFLPERDGALVSWSQSDGVQHDVLGSVLSGSALAAQEIVKLTDEPDGADQYRSKIASNASGQSVVAWLDERNGDYEVWCQRFDAQGSRVGENVLVSAVGQWTYAPPPAVAITPSGAFIIAYHQTINNRDVIAMQRFDSDGVPIGVEIHTGEDECEPVIQFAVGAMADGSALLVWDCISERPNGELQEQIVARRYSPKGNPLGIQPIVLATAKYISEWLRIGNVFESAQSSATVSFVLEGFNNQEEFSLIFGCDVDVSGQVQPTRVLASNNEWIHTFVVDGNEHGLLVQFMTTVDRNNLHLRRFDASGTLEATANLTTNDLMRVPLASILRSDYSSVVAYFDYGATGAPAQWFRRVKTQSLDAELVPCSLASEAHAFSAIQSAGDTVVAAFGSDRLLFSTTIISGTDQGTDIQGGVSGFTTCPTADINGDGQVDGADLALLLGNWGSPGASDINQDGTTDGADLTELLSHWNA